MGRLGSESRLVGRIGSGVFVSASLKKNARLVGWLKSGPRLVPTGPMYSVYSRPSKLVPVDSSYAISYWRQTAPYNVYWTG